MTRRCPGCYDSFSGPWCDNCDQWPCTCEPDDTPDPDSGRARAEAASADLGHTARTEAGQ